MKSALERLLRGLLVVATGTEYTARSNCRVCGRALTSAASVAAGVGPVCAHGSRIQRDDKTIELFGYDPSIPPVVEIA